MSVTRLKRKHRKNIARANNEVKKIKDLLRTPVLKNVDLDELKSRFGTTAPAPAEAEKKKPSQPESGVKAEPKAESEGIFAKVAHAASAAADAVKHAAADAVDAVSHSSVVESVKETASHAADAVSHSAVGESVQQAAHNLVEGAKHVLHPEPAASEPTTQNAAAVNQTGTEGFDAAEAETKPVNADGQEGEHPKPEIHL